MPLDGKGSATIICDAQPTDSGLRICAVPTDDQKRGRADGG